MKTSSGKQYFKYKIFIDLEFGNYTTSCTRINKLEKKYLYF